MTQNPSSPALIVQGVSVSLSGCDILREVSFSASAGSLTAIIGPNGAGKSTLLKSIVGLVPITSGGVTLAGRSLTTLSHRDRARCVSYAPQQVDRAWGFRALEFVEMSFYADGMRFGGPESRRRAGEALERLGMELFAERMMDTLSGGELQKIHIAATLAQKSAVTLLDEPTAFLDPHHQLEIAHLVSQAAHQDGVCVVIVTHDINAALALADQVIALVGGRIVFAGAPRELQNAARLREIYNAEFRCSPGDSEAAFAVTPAWNTIGRSASERQKPDSGFAPEEQK